MDCLQLLKDEHDEVKKLFKQLDKAEGAQAGRLWREISMKLSLHEELEETYFYPQLRKDERAKEIVLEGYQEHHVMDVLIEEINGLEPDDEAFHPKATVLQENTEHHIEEEEGELFPKVRKIWDLDKRKEVGTSMEEMKRQRMKEQRAA
jgi:hemerythrin-like domain-containing protein